MLLPILSLHHAALKWGAFWSLPTGLCTCPCQSSEKEAATASSGCRHPTSSLSSSTLFSVTLANRRAWKKQLPSARALPSLHSCSARLLSSSSCKGFESQEEEEEAKTPGASVLSIMHNAAVVHRFFPDPDGFRRLVLDPLCHLRTPNQAPLSSIPREGSSVKPK